GVAREARGHLGPGLGVSADGGEEGGRVRVVIPIHRVVVRSLGTRGPLHEGHIPRLDGEGNGGRCGIGEKACGGGSSDRGEEKAKGEEQTQACGHGEASARTGTRSLNPVVRPGYSRPWRWEITSC